VTLGTTLVNPDAEDHSTLAPQSVTLTRTIVQRLQTILAIEAVMACDVLGDEAKPPQLGVGSITICETVGEVAAVVSRCRQNRLICVLDVHDTVGRGELAGAATLAEAVQYWVRIRSALAGQENHVILNIGDEPYGSHNARTWVADTSAAVRMMRAAGFRHALMVDAPDWGQDDSFVMRDHAGAVFAADPRADTIFSVHMYGVFNTPARVRNYMGSFVRQRLALVVGEFGYEHTWGNPDEDAIMAYAQADHVGYLGWSWSGNDPLVGYLDMVLDFDPRRRTWWGNRFIAGPNGLRTTSQEATIYHAGG